MPDYFLNGVEIQHSAVADPTMTKGLTYDGQNNWLWVHNPLLTSATVSSTWGQSGEFTFRDFIASSNMLVPVYTSGTLPTPGIGGRVIYTSDDHSLRYDNGTTWSVIGSSGGTLTGGGAMNQVAVWSGATSLGGSNDLVYDGAKLIATKPIVTTSDPTYSFAPIANPSIATLGAVVAQGSTSSSSRVFHGSFGLTVNAAPGGDKVGLYSGVDVVSGSNLADSWSLNTVLTMQAMSGSGYNALGYELDFNNLAGNRGTADGAAGLAAPVAYGLAVTGAGNNSSTAAILVSGPGSTKIWNRGIAFVNDCISTTGSTFQDFTSGSKSIDIRGGPTFAIYQEFVGSKNFFCGPVQMGNGVFNAPSVAVQAASTTAPVARYELQDAGTINAPNVFNLVHTTSGVMADGFGARFNFVHRDSDNMDNSVARMFSSRTNGLDSDAGLIFQTSVGGSFGTRLQIIANGDVNVAQGLSTNTLATLGDTIIGGSLRLATSTRAALPTGNVAGRLRYITDSVRGLVYDNGSFWVPTNVPADIRAFGAICDMQFISTGAITALGSTVTSTVGVFASTDVGKSIVIVGAGAGGRCMVSTINTFISATQVTCNTVADTTVGPTADVYWGTNANTAVQAALAATYWVFLPAGALWIPTLYSIPAGCRVSGENSLLSVVVPVDGSSIVSFLGLGIRAIIENVTLKDFNSIGTVRCTFGYNNNFTEALRATSTVGQNVCADYTKAGKTGSLSEVGIAVTHDGLGSGDNFYAQSTAASTQMADALYRGDGFGGTFNGTIGKAFSCASFNFFSGTYDSRCQIIGITDESNVADSIFHQSVARTSTNAFTLRHFTSTWSSGAMVALQGAFSTGTFNANFITASNGVTTRFNVDSLGTIAINGGHIQMAEIADPSAPAGNNGRLYVRDNGSGKTQLVCRFPTGAIQVICTEP